MACRGSRRQFDCGQQGIGQCQRDHHHFVTEPVHQILGCRHADLDGSQGREPKPQNQRESEDPSDRSRAGLMTLEVSELFVLLANLAHRDQDNRCGQGGVSHGYQPLDQYRQTPVRQREHEQYDEVKQDQQAHGNHGSLGPPAMLLPIGCGDVNRRRAKRLGTKRGWLLQDWSPKCRLTNKPRTDARLELTIIIWK